MQAASALFAVKMISWPIPSNPFSVTSTLVFHPQVDFVSTVSPSGSGDILGVFRAAVNGVIVGIFDSPGVVTSTKPVSADYGKNMITPADFLFRYIGRLPVEKRVRQSRRRIFSLDSARCDFGEMSLQIQKQVSR